MVPAYDIFRIEPDGSLLWREAVDSLEEVEARVAALAASVPAQYLFAANEPDS